MEKRVIFEHEGGVAILTPVLECGLTVEEIAAKDVPANTSYEIVDVSVIPTDRTFRNAWIKNGATVVHDMSKAKTIAHEKRRAKRAAEFAPYDEVISKRIPGNSEQAAEAARQAIRDKYAVMQTQIDAASTPEELKTILEIS